SLTACFTVRSERSWFAGYKSKTSVTAVFKLAGGPINIMPPRSLCMDSTKADKWQADNISIRESTFMFFISYPPTQTIIIHLVLAWCLPGARLVLAWCVAWYFILLIAPYFARVFERRNVFLLLCY